MFCTQCGNEVKENSKFCPSCGYANTSSGDQQMSSAAKQSVQFSKLGLSLQLFGSTLYFLGIINLLGLIVVTGYVFLAETDDRLKKNALKAVFIAVSVALLRVGVGYIDNIFAALNIMILWVSNTAPLKWPANIGTLLRYVIDLAGTGLLLSLGILTLLGKDRKTNKCDLFIGKHHLNK